MTFGKSGSFMPRKKREGDVLTLALLKAFRPWPRSWPWQKARALYWWRWKISHLSCPDPSFSCPHLTFSWIPYSAVVIGQQMWLIAFALQYFNPQETGFSMEIWTHTKYNYFFFFHRFYRRLEVTAYINNYFTLLACWGKRSQKKKKKKWARDWENERGSEKGKGDREGVSWMEESYIT